MLDFLKRKRKNGNGGGAVALEEMVEGEGISLLCCDCGEVFSFAPGEQKFYSEKGLAPPKRCPACRRWKKFMKLHPELQGDEHGR
jgi:hypothetical protein